MIAILHGYLLEGSGSNLWTRSIIESLCINGETVHLVCQENHPELYESISEVILYRLNGETETILNRKSPHSGRCIMHKPELGKTLPVYVTDKYEEFTDVRPMVDLSDEEVDNYLQVNIKTLQRVVTENNINALLANHAVLMSVVAQRVANLQNIPYAIMPHGSAIEYAVKKDKRFFNYAESAFKDAKRIYVIGNEIRSRVNKLFPSIPDMDPKMIDLNLGVNTALFNPVKVSNRTESISKLCSLLAGVKRGKTEDQSRQLVKGLSPDISKAELTTLIQDSSTYNAKLTDTNAEEKLQMIDWENEKIILFVGRLIASKGLHSIVAALPEILDKEPNARLVVVGHGPQRESLEAMIWAFKNGHTDLVKNIVKWGRELEDNGDKHLEEFQLYLDHLEKTGELDNYFAKAQKYINEDRIVFTGYLTHRELCCLFPTCDVAIFPSVVAEAGPLVFLEAMASGCFPIGTYFAGMGASIDSVSYAIPPEVVDLMKLSSNAHQTVRDIVTNVKSALYVDETYKDKLRQVAIEKYDWNNISKKLSTDLQALS